jgi:hypothetical protein
VRDTTLGGDENINFLFECSQAMPASPSDKQLLEKQQHIMFGGSTGVQMGWCSNITIF